MNTVSLLILAFNEIRFIRKTLESAIGEADEIIISDNASTDGTSEVCAEYASRYPDIIKYSIYEGSNLVERFNLLFSQTNGDFIRLIGAHDIITPGSTKSMLMLLENNPDAVVAYQNHSIYLNPDYSINYYFTSESLGDALESDSVFTRMSAIFHYGFDCAMYYALYRKNALVRNFFGFYCNGSITDQGLFIRLLAEGKVCCDKKNLGVFMVPRCRFYGEAEPEKSRDYLIDEVKRSSSMMLSNMYSFRFAALCEEYVVLKGLEKLPNAPQNFVKKMLELIIPYWIFLPYPIDRAGLYIPDGGEKDEIREEMFDVVVAYQQGLKNSAVPRMNAEKRFYKIVRKIIKNILPYFFVKKIKRLGL
jgi:glycosyltransferase involved in cell wall biosynthesis